MTTLVWDQIGERVYQTGVDRGVLYLHNGTVVVWNGLTDIEESPNSELKSFFLDGVKYLESLIPGDFIGKLKAYTYPDEFDFVNGINRPVEGLNFHDQPPKSFNLSYRTRVGNDLEGSDHGYKIHILYNVIATPDVFTFGTLKNQIDPVEFGWTLTGTPVKFDGIRPTVHVSMDSRTSDPEDLATLEGILYGTETTEPFLPSIFEVALIFGYLGNLTIVDNGDGTWTAIDIGTESITTYISMIDETTFQIDNADATYSDPDTYDISSTTGGWE